VHESLQELIDKIAECMPPRDSRTAEDARSAAGAIARGLGEFAVFELQPEVFQKVVLGRLQQIADHANELEDLFELVSERLPPGPADLGEIKIYLNSLIDWLSSDPWPQDQRLGGRMLRPPALVERPADDQRQY
jgi:hypothetical protein